MYRFSTVVLLFSALALGGCGDDGSGPTDAAAGDTGPGDTGPGDTGPGDTGPGDTGPGDTGPGDTGPGDTGPGDTGPGDTGPGDAAADGAMDTGVDGSVDATVDGGGPTACIDFMVTTTGAAVLTGTTRGAGADFDSPGCEGFGPDVTVLFTAPTTSSYVFDTLGSVFDTVLSVRAPDCDAALELACSDDTDDDPDSTVAMFLEADEQVLVNVDGLGVSDDGDFVLNITPVADTCPDTELASALATTVGELTATTPDNRTGSCSFGGGGRDLAYRWTAPRAGVYTFETNTSVDTVLYLLDGDCGGAELACNDDFSGAAESSITVTLAASQTVVVVVEGFTAADVGTFDLSIMGPT